MKSNDKIYAFFIALALAYWNPLSYFLIFGNAQIFSKKANFIFYCIYSLIFTCGMLFIYLLRKNKFNEKLKNIIFAIAVTGLLFSALFLVDRLLGLKSRDEGTQLQIQKGLIFEPNSRARYQTIEFDFVADINSLGLRDREIRIVKGDKYRILCFGDSFTFGWGVNVENSWPRKLEKYLLANGYENIEVINCGRGGQYTSTYKKYLAKAVPLLKPDLVLVGVMQADDLAQLYEHNSISKRTSVAREIKSIITTYLKYSFKNTLSLRSNKETKTIKIQSNWEKSSTSMIENFTHLQTIRFHTLDDSVQRLFKSGNLNPGLLKYYINFPDRDIIFNNPAHPATKYSIQAMGKDLKEMKDICHRYNSNLVFVNLANNRFTGHIVVRTPSDVLNSYFTANNNIDPIYRSIANANEMPYMELTKHFIGLQNKSEYFFRYDGHPNEKGYEEIAKYIGRQLIEQDILKKE
jgi:lysophospholipase L1-like esterase